ncbi:MAG: glycerate kinase [Bacteroidota bacterium]|nr:glycerate kinase [Bacteroidota bacterium]
MKVVIAPDSFKESMSAKTVAECIRNGIEQVRNDVTCVMVPMADGGEGTVQALVDATKGEILNVQVEDPLGRPVNSFLGILGDRKTAIIEMAAASGLELLKDKERNPLITSTYGTGQLILAAIQKDCKKIIVGIGGSATNDGGAGMMQALGIKLLDKKGKEIRRGGESLDKLAGIDARAIDKRIADVEFLIASDVDNPLLGKSGATHVFSPQKGATKTSIDALEKNMLHFANLIESHTGSQVRELPGSGAAGGLGFGMMSMLNARSEPGFDIVAKITELEKKMTRADLVITGEGKIDSQTKFGKTPWGVAMMAKKKEIPSIAFAGRISDNANELYKNDFRSIIEVSDRSMDLKSAMKNGKKLLTLAVNNYFQTFKVQTPSGYKPE